MSYLRFTPPEYDAVLRVCRCLDVGDSSFAIFKCFLVEALLDGWPRLARRIALFRPSQLRLLFDHIRGRKGHAGNFLTPHETRVMAEACNSWAPRHRFLHYYKCLLVRLFRRVMPSLAKKLARMSDEQFQELYGRVRGRRSQS